MKRLATGLAVVAAVGLVSTPAARTASVPIDLCGIVGVLDSLFCKPRPSQNPPSEAPPSATPPSEAQSASDRVPRSSTTPRYDPTRIVVRFKPRATQAEIKTALDEAGVELERRLTRIGLYVVKVAPDRQEEAIRSLHSSAAVAGAERDVIAELLAVQPDDEAWGGQWGLRMVGIPRAWEVTTGSRTLVVAVVDTGVDSSHPDLEGATVAGYDFVNGDADASDDHGHGTAVAGVIAARSNNHRGSAGVCWSCRIMPVKVLDAAGIGSTSTIAAGIIWAVDRGARVINLSLGAPATTGALSEAVRYASAKGAVVVAAAGNAGSTLPFYPAAEPESISVAGTDAGDGLYRWSNRGSWTRLGAPGCNPAPWPGGLMVEFCGTSSAAPVVAGTVALMLSAKPSLPPDEIVAALSRFAVPVADIQSGRIDAASAIAALGVPAIARATVRSSKGPTSYRVSAGQGVVVATLTSRSGSRLRLLLRDARGRTLAVASGRGRLQVRRAVAAGTYTLTVRSTKGRFWLTVSYPIRTGGA